MRFSLCYGSGAFLAGITTLQLFERLPDISMGVACCGLAALCFIFAMRLRRDCRRSAWPCILQLTAIALLGFSWILLWAHHRLDWQLPPALWRKTILVQGRIASIPKAVGRHAIQFLFDVQHSALLKIRAPVRIRLSWYGHNQKQPVHVGEAWQLAVRLKPPHGLANPGSADFERIAFYQGIRALGYVKKSAKNQRQSAAYRPSIDRLRARIAQRLEHRLGDDRFLGIITALSVGIQSQISAAQWQVFRRTGTNHLVAISGLHIGLVAGFFFGIIQFVWRRIPPLVNRLPASFPASLLSLVAAIIYSGLAGFSVSTQRALIMISVAVLLHCTYRRKRVWETLTLALFVVLLINPLNALTAGFWLSFGAVAFIFYALSDETGSHKLWQWGRVQLFISVGLLPLSLFYFQQVSLVANLANLIAIPWMSFIVIPLCLLSVALLFCLPALGEQLLQLTHYSLALLWWVLQRFSEMPYAVWHHPPLDGGLLILAMLGGVIVLAQRLGRWRWLGLWGLLPLLFYPSFAPPFGEIRLSLLDVGQGLSAVIRTQHHTLIFDAGPKFGPNFDMGKAVVLPFLYARHISAVDTLVISHGDNDHIGGAYSLIRSDIPVRHILSSVPDRFPRELASACRAGRQWQWDGVTFTMLGPLLIDKRTSTNDKSCVLRIANHAHSILLTGDIEKKGERLLVKRLGRGLASEVLVAPHHGSLSSSSEIFIENVQPRYVLFPVGFLNRFHFPREAIIRRYKALARITHPIRLLSTARCGAIIIKLPVQALPGVSCYRQENRWYYSFNVLWRRLK